MNSYTDSIAQAALDMLSKMPKFAWSARAYELASQGGVLITGWTRISLPEDSWVEVSNDYARLGSPGKNILLPMSGVNFDKLAEKYDCALPTEFIVRATWSKSSIKVPSRSMPASADFASASTHSAWADQVILGSKELVAGHKKDVVYAEQRQAGRLAIFGWQGVTGVPTQMLNWTAHNDEYYDYSHGSRWVKREAQLRGKPVDYLAALSDPAACKVFTGSAKPIVRPRYVSLAVPTNRYELRLGTHGESVRAWQLILQQLGVTDDQNKFIVVDGQFGPRTMQATNKLRKRLQLPPTGVVDQALREKVQASEAITEREIPTMNKFQLIPYDPKLVKFVQARGYNALPNRKIDLIVIHTMEAPVTLKTAENVSSWFAGPNAPKASAHYCIDPDSIVQCVKDMDVAWHAPGANNNGIGIEHAGYAKWTREEWLTDNNRPMLERSAGLIKHLHELYGVPFDIVTEADLRAGGARGITTHAAVSKAFGKSNHWDPGPGFPLADLIDLASSVSVA